MPINCAQTEVLKKDEYRQLYLKLMETYGCLFIPV